jgi:hypothetical protein
VAGAIRDLSALFLAALGLFLAALASAAFFPAMRVASAPSTA